MILQRSTLNYRYSESLKESINNLRHRLSRCFSNGLYSYCFIFILFLLFHIAFFNINVAEWGDSYRILRGAQSLIEQGTYPMDEKRPPLFSVLLATRPSFIEDPVTYGRLIMFIISVVSFWLFAGILSKWFNDVRMRALSLLLFAFNPVYFYWSLRIMADSFFLFFVLILFFLHIRWRDHLNPMRLIVLGILSGLAILTRFEGFLLAGALFVSIVVQDRLGPLKSYFLKFFSRWRVWLTYLVGLFIILIPYILWRPPWSSSYLGEPTHRVYNLNTLISYSLSLMFLFGFVPAVVFVPIWLDELIQVLKDQAFLSVYLILELLLILAWPAAIPRLFVAVVPFLILIVMRGIYIYFTNLGFEPHIMFKLSLGLLIIFIGGQFIYRLQFLIVNKLLFLIVVLVQLPIVYAIYEKKFKLFYISVVVSLLLWSSFVVWLHKDILRSVHDAGVFVAHNLHGVVGYNDVSSISNWYTNDYPGRNTDLRGVYYNTESASNLGLNDLKSKGLDFLVITNEHNPTMTLDLNKRPYLQVIRKFSYNVKDVKFFTLVLKINPTTNGKAIQ